MNAAEAASVGIIGGADGPTAIFVTSDISLLSLLSGGIAAAAVIIAVVLVIMQLRK